jgi:hypothetical protein
MALPNEEFPTSQGSPATVRVTPSPSLVQNDPMINRGLQKEQYLGIFSVAISLILVVGFFSRKVEYALMFATALSVVLIVFFLTL